MQDAIVVENLGKRFNRFHPDKPNTIMAAALAGLRKLKPIDQFWALRHISFTVAAGEMLGIVGRNGAGKSTLLQLIGGVGCPNEGRVRVRGKIGALLDLGSGFHGDLTGRENVFVTAIVAGLTEREVARRFEAIVEFAELSEFIDNPVRTYSTGMQMRLAFSIAVHTRPDLLLVDEFLSVGDLAFQEKCLSRITELKKQGCAIVLISHSPDQVRKLCDRALWLKQGRMVAYGAPEQVTEQYVNAMLMETQKRTPDRPAQLTRSGTELRLHENRSGSLEIEITDVRLLPAEQISSSQSLCLEIDFFAEQFVAAPIFGVAIHHEDGQLCFDTNTDNNRSFLPTFQGKGSVKLHLDRLDLSSGKYYISIGIYEKDWQYTYDHHWQAYPLTIQSNGKTKGILHPPHRWEPAHLQVSNLEKN